jgi:hypothetical protein
MSDRAMNTGDLYGTTAGASGGATGQGEARSPQEPGPQPWTIDSWRSNLLAADPTQEPKRNFLERLRGFLSNQAEYRNERGEVDQAALDAALVEAAQAISSPEFASWMQPLMGPTTAVAAGIRGENPFEAARDQSFSTEVVGYDENGNPIDATVWSRPDVSTELIDRGVNPVLAMAIDMLLVPDPFGVGKAADLIPLLSFLGPVGLRMLARKGSQVQFMPANVLVEAAGNLPRRTAPEMTQFRRMIQFDPGGLQEPLTIIYDPNSMRWYLGEGNHRALAALEADAPVPVTVIRGRVTEGRGAPIPEAGQEALRTLAEQRHGYTPGSATPGQLGLPTYDEESLLQYIIQHGEDILAPLTDGDIAEVVEILTRSANEAMQQVSPQVGTTITRGAQAVEDYTPTMRLGASTRRTAMMREGLAGADDFPIEPRAYTQKMIDDYGWDEGMRLISEDTGLSQEEILYMHQRWVDMDQGIDRAMYEGGVLARDPGMPADPPYRPGEDPRTAFDFSDIYKVGEEIMSEADVAARAQQWADPAYMNAMLDKLTSINPEDAPGAIRRLEALRADARGAGRLMTDADAQRTLDLIDQRIAQVEFGSLADAGGDMLRNQRQWADPAYVNNQIDILESVGRNPEDMIDSLRNVRRWVDGFTELSDAERATALRAIDQRIARYSDDAFGRLADEGAEIVAENEAVAAARRRDIDAERRTRATLDAEASEAATRAAERAAADFADELRSASGGSRDMDYIAVLAEDWYRKDGIFTELFANTPDGVDPTMLSSFQESTGNLIRTIDQHMNDATPEQAAALRKIREHVVGRADGTLDFPANVKPGAEAAVGQQAGMPDPRYAHVEGVFESPEFGVRLSNVTREIDAFDSLKGASVDDVNGLARQLSELDEAVVGYEWGWHSAEELARATEAREAIQAQRARLWRAANDHLPPEALSGVDSSLRPRELMAAPAARFNTGNAAWDAKLDDFSARMKRVNEAIDSGNMTPEATREANALFSDMIEFVTEIQAADEAVWAARGQDLDEGLWMIKEFLENIRKNIDPMGGLL